MEQFDLKHHIRDLRISRDLDVHAEEINEQVAMKALTDAGLSPETIELLVKREQLQMAKSNANDWDSQMMAREIFSLNVKISHLAVKGNISTDIQSHLGILRIDRSHL